MDGIQKESSFLPPGLSLRENQERSEDFLVYEGARKLLAGKLNALNAQSVEWWKDSKAIAIADRLKGDMDGVMFRFYVQEAHDRPNNFVYGVKLDPNDENYRTADPIASRGMGTDCRHIQHVRFLDDRMPTGILSEAVAKLDQVPDSDLVVVHL